MFAFDLVVHFSLTPFLLLFFSPTNEPHLKKNHSIVLLDSCQDYRNSTYTVCGLGDLHQNSSDEK